MNIQPVQDNGPHCARCHYWTFLSSATGQCRRMPPAAHFEDGHYWPITGRSDWCGEFATTFSKTIQSIAAKDTP